MTLESLMVILLACVTLVSCAVPGYVLLGLKRARSYRPPQPEDPPPLSIVIAVHNGGDSLGRCLEGIRCQNYPAEKREIVVVNDRSTDGTAAILEECQSRIPGLKVLAVDSLHPTMTPKKHALASGIAASANEFLLFTDADCVPEREWLRSMAARFMAGADVVIGYSPVAVSDGSERRPISPRSPFRLRRDGGMERLIDDRSRHSSSAGEGRTQHDTIPGVIGSRMAAFLSRHETKRTGAMLTGFASNGQPYMAVGRNWGYRKSVYQQSGGLESIGRHLSGDDDLLLQAMIRRGRPRVIPCIEEGSEVGTAAPPRFADYLRQKMRHYSAARHYSLRMQSVLGLTQLFFILSLAGSIAASTTIHPAYLLLPFVPAALQQWCTVTFTGFFQRRKGTTTTRTFIVGTVIEPLLFLFFGMVGLAGLIREPAWR